MLTDCGPELKMLFPGVITGAFREIAYLVFKYASTATRCEADNGALYTIISAICPGKKSLLAIDCPR